MQGSRGVLYERKVVQGATTSLLRQKPAVKYVMLETYACIQNLLD